MSFPFGNSENQEERDREYLRRIERFCPMKLEIDELTLNTRSLEILDLAENRSLGIKSWVRSIKKGLSRHIEQKDPEFYRRIQEQNALRIALDLGIDDESEMMERLYHIKLDDVKNELKEKILDILLVHSKRVTEDMMAQIPASSENVMNVIQKDYDRVALFKYFKLVGLLEGCFHGKSQTASHFGVIFNKISAYLYYKFRDDSELVVSLLSLCATDELKRKMFSTYRLRFFLEHCGSFDFWGLRTNTGELSQIFNPVQTSFADGHFINALTLLEFGFRHDFTERNHRKLCDQLRRNRIVRRRSYPRLEEMWHDKRLTLAIQLVTAYTSNRLVRELAVKSFAGLSECSKEPFLTPCEVHAKMKGFVHPRFSQELIRICLEYRNGNVHREQYETYSPRSLFHLSRCAIHQSMAVKLPGGMKELQLPESYLQR